MNDQRNEQLWRKAQSRVAFKRHLITYLLVIGGLWLLYLYMRTRFDSYNVHPWPIWPTLGWGIGLGSHYFGAYGNNNEASRVEAEYKKLMSER